MFMTKAQIEQQRKQLQEQLKALEEREKNSAKQQEGLEKIKDLHEKYLKDRQAILVKYNLSNRDIEQFDKPLTDAILKIEYKAKVGASTVDKVYEWFPGKIGKMPEPLTNALLAGEKWRDYLTEHGKALVEKEDGSGMKIINELIETKQKAKEKSEKKAKEELAAQEQKVAQMQAAEAAVKTNNPFPAPGQIHEPATV